MLASESAPVWHSDQYAVNDHVYARIHMFTKDSQNMNKLASFSAEYVQLSPRLSKMWKYYAPCNNMQFVDYQNPQNLAN